MATDIEQDVTSEARRAMLHHLAYVLSLAFNLAEVHRIQLARALSCGTVRLPQRDLEIPSYLWDKTDERIERKRGLLAAWLADASGLPENWATGLVNKLKPTTTLIRWDEHGLYVEHDLQFAPPPPSKASAAATDSA